MNAMVNERTMNGHQSMEWTANGQPMGNEWMCHSEWTANGQ